MVEDDLVAENAIYQRRNSEHVILSAAQPQAPSFDRLRMTMGWRRAFG